MRFRNGLTAAGVALAMLVPFHTRPAAAQDVGPAQEQELRDARGALESARKGPGEKFAAEQLKQAQASLQDAEEARKQKDAERFSRAARLARAYAELSGALGELGVESENLAATSESLQKARAEIERLNNTKEGAQP
jgi:hypothetical protein